MSRALHNRGRWWCSRSLSNVCEHTAHDASHLAGWPPCWLHTGTGRRQHSLPNTPYTLWRRGWPGHARHDNLAGIGSGSGSRRHLGGSGRPSVCLHTVFPRALSNLPWPWCLQVKGQGFTMYSQGVVLAWRGRRVAARHKLTSQKCHVQEGRACVRRPRHGQPRRARRAAAAPSTTDTRLPMAPHYCHPACICNY